MAGEAGEEQMKISALLEAIITHAVYHEALRLRAKLWVEEHHIKKKE